MIGLLMPLAGILSSLLLVNRKSESSVLKIIVGAAALYFSIVIIVGLYLDSAGLPIIPEIFLMIFLIIFVLQSHRGRDLRELLPSGNAGEQLIFFGIVAVGLAYFLYPALPDLYPIGATQDSARHFALSQYIQENQGLVRGVLEEWGEEFPVSSYPFGWHLHAALLASATQMPLIKFVFPFSAFIAALSAGAIYGMAQNITGNRTAAIFSCLLFVTSVNVHNMLSGFTSWGMLFAGFLSLAFTWFLMDYSKDRGLATLLVLVILESAVTLSYPMWAVVLLLAFLMVIIIEDMPFREKIISGALFVGLGTALTAGFWLNKFGAARMRLYESGPVMENPLMLIGVILISLAALGMSQYRRENRFLYALLLAMALMPLGLLLYSFLAPVSQYWYQKTYLLLEYPLVLFAAIGLGRIFSYFRNKYTTREGRIRYAAYLFLALLLISIAYVKFSKAEDLRYRFKNITPREYDFARWIRTNLPEGEKITFVNFEDDQITINWVIAVSRHGWELTGKTVVVKDITKVPKEILEKYQVLNRADGLASMRLKS